MLSASRSAASSVSCAHACASPLPETTMGGCDMRDSPIMAELKEGLRNAGIKYGDGSIEQVGIDGETYIQSVSWAHDGNEATAMYGWCVDYDGECIGVTKGWRFGYLEFYPHGVDAGGSRMATVDEILEDVLQ